MNDDKELEALRAVLAALRPLDTDQRSRIIEYVHGRLSAEIVFRAPAPERAKRKRSKS